MKKNFLLSFSLSLSISLFAIMLLITSCGEEKKAADTTENIEEDIAETPNNPANDNPSYDPNRGEGKYKDFNVEGKLDTKMADAGAQAYEVKCASCHKLTEEKLVGPGWAGVTKRRQPSWIMNFITNPDPMLDKDPAALAMLELCLVRMPNQNLTDEEARNLLEFMRKVDGVK